MRLTYRADGTIATGDCRARLHAARQRGMFAFACMLVVMLAVEVWAQAFGLRALSVLLQTESPSPPATSEVQAPLVQIRKPSRKHVKRVVMGDVPLEGL